MSSFNGRPRLPARPTDSQRLKGLIAWYGIEPRPPKSAPPPLRKAEDYPSEFDTRKNCKVRPKKHDNEKLLDRKKLFLDPVVAEEFKTSLTQQDEEIDYSLSHRETTSNDPSEDDMRKKKRESIVFTRLLMSSRKGKSRQLKQNSFLQLFHKQDNLSSPNVISDEQTVNATPDSRDSLLEYIEGKENEEPISLAHVPAKPSILVSVMEDNPLNDKDSHLNNH